MIKIENLRVYAGEKEIVKGVDLNINKGEVHAIMGANGSGKTTLSYAIAGHPFYRAEGKVLLEKENLLELSSDERAKRGVFLSFQSPPFLEGITLLQLIKKAYFSINNIEENNIQEFTKLRKKVDEALEILNLDKEFIKREVNKNFSGGEKKKAEMLQMLVLKPKFAIIDEVDSGLDVDALKLVGKAINALRGETSFLIITHYNRILKHVIPDKVHVMLNGKIIKTGGKELAEYVEEKGYSF